jgi:hypothetical protein
MSAVRSQIRPFSCEAKYATGWAGWITFDALIEDLSPILATVLYRYNGEYAQYIPDAIQIGLMRIWERLVENPSLLALDSRVRAAFKILSICKHTTYNKQRRKYVDFPGTEDNETEYTLLGYEKAPEWWNATEHWASWAAKADQQMDIATAINIIAEEYADDIKGLVALYCLTTQVNANAAIEAHGLGHSMVYIRMAEIKQKLQNLLTDYAPIQPKTWEERYHEGEIAPLEQIRQRYHDTPLALKAIDTLITDVKLRHVAKDEKERGMLMYYRKKCHRQIAAAYGQATAF